MRKDLREMHKKIMTGEGNPRWNNGVSEYPNHILLKKRRIEVLKKSKGKCEICGKPANLVHHIDGDKSNHSIDNLIALCRNCHDPLHCNSGGKSVKGRPTKYVLKYDIPIRIIANRFGVSKGTIYYWLRIPEKKEWLEKQLSEII